jgi:hypothetical protein
MNPRLSAILFLFLIVAIASPARAQQWPRDEYGSVLFTGERNFGDEAGRRPAVQLRLQNWLLKNLKQPQLVQQGKFSYRGEFYGYGQLPPVTVGDASYRLALSIGAQYEPGGCTYRLEYLQCHFLADGKAVAMPIEAFLNSPNPAHQQAAAALLTEVQKFIAAL